MSTSEHGDLALSGAADEGLASWLEDVRKGGPQPARVLGVHRLRAAARQRDIGPHGFAHLGAVDIALRSAATALDQAADEIDDDPLDRKEAGARRALRVRTLTEAVATQVLDRVGHALGAGPLGHDGDHAQRVADLTVYLRQHHAEKDLEQLGRLVAQERGGW